ncbi:unnamed protein product, partial [Mesorhabditis spiculigera]
MISVYPLNSPTASSSSSSFASFSLRQIRARQLFLPAPPNVPSGHDRQVVSYLKHKRRTIKNRGYALNCRVRRIQNHHQPATDDVLLRDQTVVSLQGWLQYYESSYSTFFNYSSRRL